MGRGIRLGTLFQADSPETSGVFEWCGGGGFRAVRVLVRRVAEELIKSTMCVWTFLAESYGQCTSPEGRGMTILTNHMRENETCNARRWTQMDTSVGKATIPSCSRHINHGTHVHKQIQR